MTHIGYLVLALLAGVALCDLTKGTHCVHRDHSCSGYPSYEDCPHPQVTYCLTEGSYWERLWLLLGLLQLRDTPMHLRVSCILQSCLFHVRLITNTTAVLLW